MSGFYFPTTALRARSVTSSYGLVGAGDTVAIATESGKIIAGEGGFLILTDGLGGQLVIPQWPLMSMIEFTAGYFSPVTVPSGVIDPFANGSLVTGRGFSASTQGYGNAVWAVTYQDYLVEQTSPTTGVVYNLPSGHTYIGIAFLNSSPYWLTSAGAVYTLVGSTVTLVTPGFGVPSTGLATDGTKLYATCPGTGLGILTLSTTSSGSVSFSTAPMTNPYMLSASASGVAVAGYTPAGLSFGTSVIQGSPLNPTTVAAVAVPGSNAVDVYTGTDPVWAFSTTCTGVTNPEWFAWVPNGEQVLVSETSANVVAVLALSGNAFSIAQSLSLSAPGQISFTPTSDQALVCQPSSNQIAVLINTLGTWAVGTPTSVTSPKTVLVLSETSAVCGDGTSVAVLARTGSTWSVNSTISVGFTPSDIVIGASSSVLYVAGTSGSTGNLSLITNDVVSSTVSWTGAAAGVIYLQGQVGVIDTSVPDIRWFDSNLNAQGTQAVPTGTTQFGISGTSVWLGGTSATWQMTFDAPYKLGRLNTGVIGLYKSSAWTSVTYNVAAEPAGLVWGSGNTLYMATAQNEYYEYSTSGSLTQTAWGSVQVYTGQNEGTGLGISSLSTFNSGLYATTYASGVLMKVL